MVGVVLRRNSVVGGRRTRQRQQPIVGSLLDEAGLDIEWESSEAFSEEATPLGVVAFFACFSHIEGHESRAPVRVVVGPGLIPKPFQFGCSFASPFNPSHHLGDFIRGLVGRRGATEHAGQVPQVLPHPLEPWSVMVVDLSQVGE